MKLLTIFLSIASLSFAQVKTSIESSTYFVSTSMVYFHDCDITINGTLNVNGTVKIRNGNFDLNGTLVSNTSEFRFYNDTTHDHNIWATTPCNFYDLYVGGNPSNIYDTHLNTDIGVSNKLDVQTEKLNVNNYVIDLGTTGYVYSEGNGQYIYDENGNSSSGNVRGNNPNIGTNTTANTGNIGITITTHGNAMGNTVIKRYHRQADIGGGILSIPRIFEVTPTYNGSNYGGNLNVDLKILYFDDILNGIDPSTLKVYRSGDGGVTWENKGGTVDLVNKWVTVTGFNQFSQVTLAPDNAQPLPVTLIQFEGVSYPQWNVIKWATASEHNSMKFDLESSLDGIDWRNINSRAGAGNSTYEIRYSFIDYNPNNLTYYRLIQYDFDGKFEIFGPICVFRDASIKKIVKYVNLMGQEVTPESKGVIFEIYEDGTSRKTIR